MSIRAEEQHNGEFCRIYFCLLYPRSGQKLTTWKCQWAQTNKKALKSLFSLAKGLAKKHSSKTIFLKKKSHYWKQTPQEKNCSPIPPHTNKGQIGSPDFTYLLSATRSQPLLHQSSIPEGQVGYLSYHPHQLVTRYPSRPSVLESWGSTSLTRYSSPGKMEPKWGSCTSNSSEW